MAPQAEDQWHGESAAYCWNLARCLAKAAWQVDRGRLPLDDYLSVAHEGLARACARYESAHAVPFLVYVKWRVRQALTDWRRHTFGDRRIAPGKRRRGYASREQSLEAILEMAYDEDGGGGLTARLRHLRALRHRLASVEGEEGAVLAEELWGKCTAELSPKQRAVMDRVVRGESAADIGQRTGQRKGTVDATIHQARQRVQQWWRREELRCARQLAS